MDAWELAELRAAQERVGRPYHEFHHVASLSVGLYRLPADGTDGQSPHAQDEIYHVLSGRALIHVGEEDRPVRAGSTVFVAAGVDHRFHAIEEDLDVLVFFAPAESSKR